MRLALALLLASPAAAQTNEGTQVAQAPVQAGDYAYQLFVPRGYAAMPKQQWPLVIFLHGSGERGVGHRTREGQRPAEDHRPPPRLPLPDDLSAA